MINRLIRRWRAQPIEPDPYAIVAQALEVEAGRLATAQLGATNEMIGDLRQQLADLAVRVEALEAAQGQARAVGD